MKNESLYYVLILSLVFLIPIVIEVVTAPEPQPREEWGSQGRLESSIELTGRTVTVKRNLTPYMDLDEDQQILTGNFTAPNTATDVSFDSNVIERNEDIIYQGFRFPGFVMSNSSDYSYIEYTDLGRVRCIAAFEPSFDLEILPNSNLDLKLFGDDWAFPFTKCGFQMTYPKITNFHYTLATEIHFPKSYQVDKSATWINCGDKSLQTKEKISLKNEQKKVLVFDHLVVPTKEQTSADNCDINFEYYPSTLYRYIFLVALIGQYWGIRRFLENNNWEGLGLAIALWTFQEALLPLNGLQRPASVTLFDGSIIIAGLIALHFEKPIQERVRTFRE